MGSPQDEILRLRTHGEADRTTLVYLPGLHGDWTLVGGFRAALKDRVRFVEFTYPRTVTWSLADYAGAIERLLLEHGLRRGWVLAESFGSQIAWSLCAGAREFVADGLILAGGFGAYPVPRLVGLAEAVFRSIPLGWFRYPFKGYRLYARFRYRAAPETLADLDEFLARRTEPDRRAALHRLRLIAGNDPAGLARSYRGPVHFLAGLVDPIVPWPLIPPWLKRHCPGYRGWRLIFGADHNVLAAGPAAARWVSAWIHREPRSPSV